LYAENEVVLDACYDDFNDIQVRGNNTNAWVGSITASIDDKSSYSAMRCDDGCISRDGSNTTSTSRITVDGNTNGAVLAPVECLDGLASEGGNNCTIVLDVSVS